VILYKEFTFDSAHFLPNVPEHHKCRQLHGHTYLLKIFVEGDVLRERGWILDFGDLKKAVKPVIEMVDHLYLNEIPGLENPTTEMFSIWLWNKMKPMLPGLKRIELKETPSSGVIYEGD
jgi:6-pyruvoyltetrahydropterin/6-carboxytetrahydropterin synthase